ncbi:MAG: hypothetical protein QOE54_1260 [Streptosporangiaceae bacterium]|jgi:hypothetical protein|nr:hypothetical protein [Streptosporangiaceae bacterium]MDX6428894.1 hypothetical protein [Streptosporangiaceae bacterium]
MIPSTVGQAAGRTAKRAAGRVAGGATARGLACGLAGTSAMTLTAALYARLRGETDRILDYDTSEHVAIAAATVLRVHPRSDTGERALFHLVHWGYGSAVGIAYQAIRHAVPSRPAAASVFFTGCQTMAFVLFPLLGRTPPPWRWRRDVIAISLLQHAVYAATVDLTDRALGPEVRDPGSGSSLAGPAGPDSAGRPRRVTTQAGQGLRGASRCPGCGAA